MEQLELAESRQMRLKIERESPLPYPPKFIIPLPAHQLLSTQERLTITVETEARPPVTRFIWFVNGFELRSGKNVNIVERENRCTIIVARPRAGEYKVIARNEAGEATSVGSVDIEGQFRTGAGLATRVSYPKVSACYA